MVVGTYYQPIHKITIMDILLAKIDENGIIDTRRCQHLQGEYITKLRNAGYLDFVPSEQPRCDAGYIAKDSFTIVDGKVVQSWETKIDTETIETQIGELKQRLSESDYKVTKCYECSLVGETLPYDIQALHDERQAIRDEINHLESLLA